MLKRELPFSELKTDAENDETTEPPDVFAPSDVLRHTAKKLDEDERGQLLLNFDTICKGYLFKLKEQLTMRLKKH